MNRRRMKQSRLRHRLALLVAGAISAATPALPCLVADETSVLRLPISSRLTAQPPVASLRVSTRRLSEQDAASDSVASATELAANNSPDTPSPAATTGQTPVDTPANPPASATAQSPDGTATQSSAMISGDSSGSSVSAPSRAPANSAETRSKANSDTKARLGSETATGTEGQSVLRSSPPERLPQVASSDTVTPSSSSLRARTSPVRLPPVESPDTLTYGAFQRSPVRVGSETIPAPVVRGGPDRSDSRSQVPSQYRLPPTPGSPTRLPPTRTPTSGLMAGQPSSPLGGPQPGAPPAPEAESSDWMSSRWHRFRSQAQHDFWGYPEYFCERPMGLPNQLAYQAMVDNARDDLLVFHQFDFHDGQVESAANLNTAGLRRIDRVAELLARQRGGSTVIVEFVPDEPRLTDARREEVAAQLGRYGFYEPAVRVAVGRARRGITGREAEGINRTFGRMTGSSVLSGSVGGMSSGSGGMSGSGMNGGGGGMNGGGMGSGGNASGGGMSGGMGSGMMGNGAGGGYGNAGAFGY